MENLKYKAWPSILLAFSSSGGHHPCLLRLLTIMKLKNCRECNNFCCTKATMKMMMKKMMSGSWSPHLVSLTFFSHSLFCFQINNNNLWIFFAANIWNETYGRDRSPPPLFICTLIYTDKGLLTSLFGPLLFYLIIYHV